MKGKGRGGGERESQADGECQGSRGGLWCFRGQEFIFHLKVKETHAMTPLPFTTRRSHASIIAIALFIGADYDV